MSAAKCDLRHRLEAHTIGPDDASLEGEEMLLAELDLAEVSEGLANLDTDGHYARPDVFELKVDTRAKDGVNWSG